MHCNVVVDKEQYDEIVKAYMEQGKQLIALQNLYDSVTNERDSWKSAYSSVKDAYEHERSLAQKYFEQSAALQRDSDMAETRYKEAKKRLEKLYAELEKHREEKESLNKSLRDKRERVFDMTVENEKLRLQADNLSRISASVCDERDEYREQIKTLRSQLEGARETSKHYAEQAARYQSERDSALEDAKRHREDYTKLSDKYTKLEKLKDEFCIEACNLSSALRARNALLQILFLATGINEDMLKEMFNCRFCTPDASFDADLARRMIQYCINNNSTIIDTLTGYRFDIADRLEKAIEVRNIYGMPLKQGANAHGDADTLAPEKQPICDAQHIADKKKKDVRAKPEQSQRRAKRGKAKPHQKGK